MKQLLTLLFICNLHAQEFNHKPIPQEVLLSAKEAVDVLGKEVQKGNYLYSLDNMYSRWKNFAASQVGGVENLRKRLESVPQNMQKQGITISGFEVGLPTQGFEVRAILAHNSDRAPEFTEYLVIVPTATIFRVIDPSTGTKRNLKSQGFQVALTNQEKTKWTFIDGGNMKASELSKLFPLLPAPGNGLTLPDRSLTELK